MAQPSGTTRYTIEVMEGQGVAAWKALAKAAAEYGIEIKKLKEESAAARTETTGIANAWLQFGRSALGTITGIASFASALQQTLRQIGRELDELDRKRQAALSTRIDVAQARANALALAHPEIGIGYSELDKMAEQAITMGFTPQEAYGGLNRLMSTAAGMSRPQIESAWQVGAMQSRLTGTRPGETASTMIDIMRSTGLKSTEEAAGLLHYFTRESRIVNLEAAAQTVPEFLATGRAAGVSPAFTTAGAAWLTQTTRDPTGEESVTAWSGLLRSIFASRRLKYRRSVPKYAIRNGQAVVVGMTEETVTEGLPLFVGPSGEAPEGVNRYFSAIDEMIRQGGLATAPQSFFTALGVPHLRAGMTREAMRARLPLRDELGALLFVQNYFANATEEEREDFLNVLNARGKSRMPVRALLMGEQKAMREFMGYYNRARERFAGGGLAEEYRRWEEESRYGMGGLGQEVLMSGAAEAMGQELELTDRRHAREELALQWLRYTLQQTSTYTEQQIETKLAKFKMLVQGNDGDPLDIVEQVLREEIVEASGRPAEPGPWKTYMKGGFGGHVARTPGKPAIPPNVPRKRALEKGLQTFLEMKSQMPTMQDITRYEQTGEDRRAAAGSTEPAAKGEVASDIYLNPKYSKLDVAGLSLEALNYDRELLRILTGADKWPWGAHWIRRQIYAGEPGTYPLRDPREWEDSPIPPVSSAAPSGQVILFNAAATPWYRAQVPLANGIGMA